MARAFEAADVLNALGYTPMNASGGDMSAMTAIPVGASGPMTIAAIAATANAAAQQTALAAETARAEAIEATIPNPAAVAFTGGTVNGVTIGGSVPAAGTFTTLSATSAVTGSGFSAWAASPPSIGGTAPAAASFTSLTASGTVSGAGFISWAASPPAIGGTAAAAGTFTNLTVTGQVQGQLQTTGPLAPNKPTTTVTGTTYTVSSTDSTLIFNLTSSCVITLPSPSPGNAGRMLFVKGQTAWAVTSSVSCTTSLSGVYGNAILSATAGKWAILQSDGAAYWQIIAGN